MTGLARRVERLERARTAAERRALTTVADRALAPRCERCGGAHLYTWAGVAMLADAEARGLAVVLCTCDPCPACVWREVLERRAGA